MSFFIFFTVTIFHSILSACSEECSSVSSLIQTLTAVQGREGQQSLTRGNSLVDLSVALQASSDVGLSSKSLAITNRSFKQVSTLFLSNSTSASAIVNHFFDDPIAFFRHIQDEPWSDLFGKEYMQDMGSVMLFWLTWFIISILFYLCCFHHRLERLPISECEDPVETMRHPFNCFQTPCICCCSFICPMIQWAETMHLANILAVLPAFAIFACCTALNLLTFTGVMLGGGFTSLLIIFYRQRLRQRFGLKSWTFDNCLLDFVYVCCCPCCAIAQEAQAVRYDYHLYEHGQRPSSLVQTQQARNLDTRVLMGPPTSGSYLSQHYSIPSTTVVPPPSSPRSRYIIPRTAGTMPPSTVVLQPAVRSLPGSANQVLAPTAVPSSGFGSPIRFTR